MQAPVTNNILHETPVCGVIHQFYKIEETRA